MEKLPAPTENVSAFCAETPTLGTGTDIISTALGISFYPLWQQLIIFLAFLYVREDKKDPDWGKKKGFAPKLRAQQPR